MPFSFASFLFQGIFTIYTFFSLFRFIQSYITFSLKNICSGIEFAMMTGIFPIGFQHRFIKSDFIGLNKVEIIPRDLHVEVNNPFLMSDGDLYQFLCDDVLLSAV